MQKHISLALYCVSLFIPFLLFADKDNAPSIGITGQVRLRANIDKKSADTSAFAKTYGELRSRLGATLAPGKKVLLKVEVQDSRMLGTEPDDAQLATVSSAKGVDLHQGYGSIQLGMFNTTLGRQKVAVGSQRLISSLEWHNVARVFDGVQMGLQFNNNMALNAYGFVVNNLLVENVNDMIILSGLHFNGNFSELFGMEAYFFNDMREGAVAPLPIRPWNLFYPGVRVKGQIGIFAYEEEFIFQVGTLPNDVNSFGFYNASRLGVRLKNKISILAGLDILSGDDLTSTDKNERYFASYFFAHTYFGWMDYFIVNPQPGVMDIRLDASIPIGKMITVKPAFHQFLPLQDDFTNNKDPYGTEIDLELHGTFFPKTKFIFGTGIFIPGDGANNTVNVAARGVDEVAYYFYFMPIFNFGSNVSLKK